jgi:hypothetical protein
MSSLLVGSTTEYTTNNVLNVLYFIKSQAVASASGATEFRVYCSNSGNVKVGVRADSTGEPGTLMGYNDSAQAVSSGWNVLTVSGNNISSGTYYWLGILSDQGVVRRETSGGTSRYVSLGYFTSYAFPTSPEAWDASANHVFSIGLWGETGSGTPISVYMNQLRQQGIA